MDNLIKILILFFLLSLIYDLICKLLIIKGYNVGGNRPSMLTLTDKDFASVKYDINEDYFITPDFHFKNLTKKWCSENNWKQLVSDGKFNYENNDKGAYVPDSVIFDGKKIVIIEFDEDGSFHSSKQREDYKNKWENYNHILRMAYKNENQMCLLRVSYGPDKHSTGLPSTENVEFTKDFTDFNDINSVEKEDIIKNNYQGALDNAYIKMLNYIDSAIDISGDLFLVYYDGSSKKIKSDLVSVKNVEKIDKDGIFQGTDYMKLLHWIK